MAEAADGTLPPEAAGLLAVLEALLTASVKDTPISTLEVLAAGVAFLGSMLFQAAAGNEWPREKEVAVRDWAIHCLAKLPFVSERDEEMNHRGTESTETREEGWEEG